MRVAGVGGTQPLAAVWDEEWDEIDHFAGVSGDEWDEIDHLPAFEMKIKLLLEDINHLVRSMIGPLPIDTSTELRPPFVVCR